MKQRLSRLINCMTDGLIEREIPARLVLLTALAGEHTLLIGEPGTAKSALARQLHKVFDAGGYFERLLTRFSVPEELFGPLSIKALENDTYLRQTARYLPSAKIAFIDEIFKANSAILNSLLTILNEREFDNGDTRLKVPLISVVGASNELPEEDELDALYDRFLCRYLVQSVSDERFTELLELTDREDAALEEADRLDQGTLNEIQASSEKVSLSEEVIECLNAMRRYMQEANIRVSDRRWRKLVKLLKVSAATNNRDRVNIWDCWLLQHCLWEQPAHQTRLQQWYESHIGIGSGFNPARLERLVKTWELTLASDSSSKTQRRNARGELLYLNPEGEKTSESIFSEWEHRDGQALYLATPDQNERSNDNQGYLLEELRQHFFDDRLQQSHINGQWQHIEDYIAVPANRFIRVHENTAYMEPTRHPDTLIQSRIRETSSIQVDIDLLNEKLQEQIDTLDETVGDHLWVDAGFVDTASQRLNETLKLAASLSGRMADTIQGFENLPRQ